MSKIQQARDLLENNRVYLLGQKEEIIKQLKNPKIVAWSEVKLSTVNNLLKALGIPSTDLQKSLTRYPDCAKEISTYLKSCHNEIANQLADLIGNKFPDKALQLAEQFQQRIHHLEDLKAALYNEIEIFFTADKMLRQNLNIESLISLAFHLGQTHKDRFNGGLEVYRIITGAVDAEQTSLTLPEACQQVEKLELRFKNIDTPTSLPRLADEVVFHYIQIGVDTIRPVADFAKATSGILAADMGAVLNIEAELSALEKEGTLTILKNIPQYAAAIGKLISGLYHKRELKTAIVKIAETLELLNIYHLALKNKIIPAIQEQVTSPQSEINPVFLAAKMTRSFFTGAKGIILTMKLMLKSLSGQEAINQVELQLILEKALNNCGIFYGKSPKDVKKLAVFINDLIKQFSQPFPYDNIFLLVKQAIATYGGSVDRFIRQYHTKKEFQAIAKTSIPATFGKLSTALVGKQSAFTKANQ
ncbi:MAG: hypothetical protein GXP59_04360 [Deltaproteobacteria bacterium]|nr:hypothetical protein [Deltaproteobacteria bacterium]